MYPLCAKNPYSHVSVLSTSEHKDNRKVESLTVSGDFIGRVEPPVTAWWHADVHVEMDVFPQPVTALLVPHEYRLLPVLWPFTAVRRKKWHRKKNIKKQGRVMRKAGPFITARDRFPLFLFQRSCEEETEKDGHRLSLTAAHSPAVTHSPGHYSACPNVSGETQCPLVKSNISLFRLRNRKQPVLKRHSFTEGTVWVSDVAQAKLN